MHGVRSVAPVAFVRSRTARALGYGVGSNPTEAKKRARADANSKDFPRGCQLKHCTYACRDPKGSPYFPRPD